jgi:hypothetical protein
VGTLAATYSLEGDDVSQFVCEHFVQKGRVGEHVRRHGDPPRADVGAAEGSAKAGLHDDRRAAGGAVGPPTPAEFGDRWRGVDRVGTERRRRARLPGDGRVAGEWHRRIVSAFGLSGRAWTVPGADDPGASRPVFIFGRLLS